MKKMIIITGTVLIAYVIFSAAVGSAAGSVSTSQAEISDDGSQVFVMRELDDRVVVYRGAILFLRTDTPVSSLPKSDRMRLAQGITVFSEKELKKLIEDYCS